MRERPILLNAEMVRAVLDGRKNQTRRAVSDKTLQLFNVAAMAGECHPLPGGNEVDQRSQSYYQEFCPFGKPGDRLYVRETWAEAGGGAPDLLLYRANYPEHVPSHYENVPPVENVRWRPSIHMPRWASRITLEITGVRVERLHAITLGDICKEIGCGLYDFRPATYGFTAWEELWRAIYGEESWQANPWVWVIEFSRVEVSGG